MGIYLNPGNNGFRQTLNARYVDKTGLIKIINSTIDTDYKLTCVSRPRRFGKTLAARMLCAYYDKSCNSENLFEKLEISKDISFRKHLNQYDVIYLDITRFISRAEKIENIVIDIQKCVIQELKNAYPECIADDTRYLPDALSEIYQKKKDRFFFIIDEWDALFREEKENTEIQKSYIQLLRGLFKGGPSSDDTIVGAYMTGILPIKKYGTESALTNFEEYTMVTPDMMASYVGFTEQEVMQLCQENDVSFEKMKQWYDGYTFETVKSIYSPNSVMSAIRRNRFGNYWTKTETYESLKKYISMNMDGLKDSVISMLGGQKIEINPLGFQNDMTSMNTRDEVLTLLVHLGYLAYDHKKSEVYIPNLEVADSFQLAVKDSGWEEIGSALEESKKLLAATIAGDTDYVAEALDKIHRNTSSVLQYNNENSLACALTIAYYTAQSDYMIVRELPSGTGFADLAFIPRKNSEKPAMIIELKYDQSADTAIRQIHENRYGGELKDYLDRMILVGINYDKKNKKHHCIIEK